MQKQFFPVISLFRPQIMATQLDVSKSRRFDAAMSRRTRRSTSLVACFQDRHQDAKLKTLLQCQDTELQAFQQCEDEKQQQTPCLYEDEELEIPHALQQYEGGEQKTLEHYQDEQEKEPRQYLDEVQKKQEQYQDEEEMKPEQYLDEEKTFQRFQYEDEKTSEFQDEKKTTPQHREDDGEEKTPEQYQEMQKAPEQCQESAELASEHYEEKEEEEEQNAQQKCHVTEQKKLEQRQGVKKLPAPPCIVDGVPRFSLQELIQEKQLPVRAAKASNKFGGHGENTLADHMVSGGGAAPGGTTLAMVIKRPEGGKKSMGMIRRCVKALNQMIKAKHGSKKNTPI